VNGHFIKVSYGSAFFEISAFYRTF
jgi:hypothetical protein